MQGQRGVSLKHFIPSNFSAISFLTSLMSCFQRCPQRLPIILADFPPFFLGEFLWSPTRLLAVVAPWSIFDHSMTQSGTLNDSCGLYDGGQDWLPTRSHKISTKIKALRTLCYCLITQHGFLYHRTDLTIQVNVQYWIFALQLRTEN